MCPSGRAPPPQFTITSSKSNFRPAFDVLDADRDGKIGRDDLLTFYNTTWSLVATEECVGAMISAADVNKDGFVEFDEFNQVLESHHHGNNNKGGGGGGGGGGRGLMEDVFRVMDRDGDGKVGFEDLRGYMKWAGIGASDEEIKGMIKMGCGDEMSGVCFDGLVKILAVHFRGDFW